MRATTAITIAVTTSITSCLVRGYKHSDYREQQTGGDYRHP